MGRHSRNGSEYSTCSQSSGLMVVMTIRGCWHPVGHAGGDTNMLWLQCAGVHNKKKNKLALSSTQACPNPKVNNVKRYLKNNLTSTVLVQRYNWFLFSCYYNLMISCTTHSVITQIMCCNHSNQLCYCFHSNTTNLSKGMFIGCSCSPLQWMFLLPHYCQHHPPLISACEYNITKALKRCTFQCCFS